MKKLLFVTILFVTILGCDSDMGQFSPMFNTSFLSIELAAMPGGNVQLTINNSGKDLFISESDIPFDNFEKDLFKIDGIQYKGRLFYNKIQTWNRLESQKEIIVHLPTLYDFQIPDVYRVYFEAAIPVKFQDGSIQIFNVVSNIIDLNIDEISIDERATMKPCTAAQRSLLARGKRISKADVANASAYLAKKKADNYYTKWFGNYSSSRFNTVLNGYNKITKSYGEGWKYSCERKADGGCKGWAAYVYKNQPYKVWVCMDYYEKTSDRNRGTLMTHEASHWNVNFGANDYGYGYDTGIALAKSDPNKAVDCANNIEYYTDDIPDVEPPVEPPGPSDDLAGFKINKRVFKPNEIIEMDCRQLNAKKNYMIGIYINEKLVGNKRRFIYNRTSALKKIKAPIKTGGYKIRLSIKDGKFLFRRTIRVR